MDAAAVAIRLLDDTDALLKPIEPFLHKGSPDGLPQARVVFDGRVPHMGPRPALVDQGEAPRELPNRCYRLRTKSVGVLNDRFMTRIPRFGARADIGLVYCLKV